MDLAASPKVLEWWKNQSHIPLSNCMQKVAQSTPQITSDGTPISSTYTTKAIDHASTTANLDILNWWLHSGLPLKYTNLSIDVASANGHIHVLQWWVDSGLEIVCNGLDQKYYGLRSFIQLRTILPIQHATQHNHIEVLEWWAAKHAERVWARDIGNRARTGGQERWGMKRAPREAKEWWKKKGLVMTWKPKMQPEHCFECSVVNCGSAAPEESIFFQTVVVRDGSRMGRRQ
ncbi:hypothetical protein HDV00_009590 [Rhizophlyctis rosea]|nr:hypothetical protein HDV00_009590 [Rhizophlyctis rosea]